MATSITSGYSATLKSVLRVAQHTRIGRVRWLVRRRALAISGLLVLFWLALGLLGPWIAPHDPQVQAFDRLRLPTLAHPLGTDPLGRDLLSRTLVGGRTALQVAFSSVVIAAVVGTTAGLYSGFRGGWVDLVLQRFVDITQSMPPLVLALLLVGVRGASKGSVIFVIVFIFAPTMTRVMRGAALSIKALDFITAARMIGVSDVRLIFRHILPNATSYAIVLVSVWMAQAIIVATSLSFLGLGVPPPTPDWGRMLSEDAITYMLVFPWIVVPPILAIVGSVLTFNLFGDALRDVLYQSDR